MIIQVNMYSNSNLLLKILFYDHCREVNCNCDQLAWYQLFTIN